MGHGVRVRKTRKKKQSQQKGGRPRLARARSGPDGRKTRRLVGWRAHRVRALMGETAYVVHVPLTPTDLWREINTICDIQRLDPPMIGEERDAVWRNQFEKEKAAVIEKYRRAPRGPTKFNRLLNAEREAGIRTLQEIRLAALYAMKAHEHPFWEAYRVQPSGHYQYWKLGNWSSLTLNRIKGCAGVTFRPYPPIRPSEHLMAEFTEQDTLDHLRIYLLLFGAAHENGWRDLYSTCFDRMVEIVSKVACLPPFATFGKEFALDLLSSPFTDGRPEPSGWRRTVVQRIQGYRRLIELAADAGIIPRNRMYPQGDRGKQYALLRYSDEVGYAEISGALQRYQVTKKSGKVCKKLLSWLEEYPSFEVLY